MSSSHNSDGEYSARKIHHSLGRPTPFWRGFTLSELLLFLAPPFVGIVLLGLPFVPARALVPILGLVFALELLLYVFHRARPTHLRLTEWLAIRLQWAVKKKTYRHDEPQQDTKGVTRVDRIYPHVLTRTDGARVGAIKIDPANMALESERAWERAVESLSNFVNTAVDFDAQLYVTTRTLDDADFVDQHRDRLGDPDVRSRPVLRKLVDWVVATSTDDQGRPIEGDSVREYYVIVSVTDDDVETLDDGQNVLQYLESLPLVGSLCTRLRSRRFAKPERESMKQDVLEDRLAQLRRGGNSLYGCETAPVDPYELATLVKEFWTCRPQDYGDLEAAIGSQAVSAHGLSEPDALASLSRRDRHLPERQRGGVAPARHDGDPSDPEPTLDTQGDAESSVTGLNEQAARDVTRGSRGPRVSRAGSPAGGSHENGSNGRDANGAVGTGGSDATEATTATRAADPPGDADTEAGDTALSTTVDRVSTRDDTADTRAPAGDAGGPVAAPEQGDRDDDPSVATERRASTGEAVSATRPETATNDHEATTDSGPSGDRPEDTIDSVARTHRGILAPSSIDWERSHAVIDGEHYVKTFWIEHFPERPQTGFLEGLLLETDLDLDVSIHVSARDNQDAKAMLSDWISTLQVNKQDVGELEQEDLQHDIERAKYIRDLIRRNEASLFECGVFVRLRADSEEELERHTRLLLSTLRDAPANCTVKEATRWQESGLATVSPIGRNELGTNRCSTMTDEAIGAMFPFSSSTLRMDDGIEYGYHGQNLSSLRVDPWELETGHSELVAGVPGAGKTFGVQARLVRMMKRRSDTMLVIVDPVGDMRGLADALDAKTITVSGTTRLNPLEIRETPQHVLDAGTDLDPLGAKKEEVYSIIENFLEARGTSVDGRSGVISYAIDAVYEQAGITADPETHGVEQSPTMRDLLEILDDMSQNPDDHPIAEAASARERAARYADELAIDLQPFRMGGSYENLGGESAINVLDGDDKVVYVDLGQVEGSAAGIEKQSFLMQLLLSHIYQQAKQSPRKVEVAIDEAHYLLQDQANLGFLNQIFRHQRHAGLRMVLMSQTVSEFYADEAAAEIAGMCPIKVLHKIPELDDEVADRLDLTEEQRWFVRNAEAGSRRAGYSQALVSIAEIGDFPLHVEADELEQLVIEYEEDEKELLDALLSDRSQHAENFASILDEEVVRNALINRYDVDPEIADDMLAEGLTEADLVTAVADSFGTQANVMQDDATFGSEAADGSDRPDSLPDTAQD